jgi:hypothetical protein
MSDGPFSSPLPKKHWRSVAERAATPSNTVTELREAIPASFISECRELPEGILKKVKRVLSQDEPDGLNVRTIPDEIARLRRDVAHLPLAASILDGVQDALERGHEGVDALVKGAAAALDRCYAENARAIEEYAQLDRRDEALTQYVRRRLEDAALGETELEAVARALVKEGEAIATTPPKHDDIMDGPLIGDDDDE